MRVCVVAEYYPRRRDPVLGIWAHRQALATRDAGADVRVLALERPIPPAGTLRSLAHGRVLPLASDMVHLARQPRLETLDDLEVEYVRFLAPAREGSYATWDRWAQRPLRRALERLDAVWPLDLIHAHYALPAGGAARPFAIERQRPLVVSVHGGDVLGPALSAPAARARVGEVLAGSAAILCNSHATLALTAALAGSSANMRVVHLGAEPPRHAQRRHHAPTLVTVAHLTARNRHADVLRALALAVRRVPDLRWLVIGDGPELPPLRRLAAELGIADRVDWAGQLAPRKAIEELARCHLMVMPSVDEAFGVAYVEAMACGVPAIGCRGEGGPEEIAALGGGMLLVGPGDIAALAQLIEDIVSDSARAQELSAAARRTAVERFSWERCGRATVAAYEDALAEAAPG